GPCPTPTPPGSSPPRRSTRSLSPPQRSSIPHRDGRTFRCPRRPTPASPTPARLARTNRQRPERPPRWLPNNRRERRGAAACNTLPAMADTTTKRKRRPKRNGDPHHVGRPHDLDRPVTFGGRELTASEAII